MAVDLIVVAVSVILIIFELQLISSDDPATVTTTRNCLYANTTIMRGKVLDKYIKWSVKVPKGKYKPVFHEKFKEKHIRQKIVDPDINDPSFKPKFNQIDGNVDRTSYYGKYEIRDGKPLNPDGRTGIEGRGQLTRYGPNHCADPIVIKWKRDAKGNVVKINKKPVLLMVAIKRVDNGQWALPGGKIDPGDKVTTTLKKEFEEGAMDGAKPEQVKAIQEFFDKSGVLVYQGPTKDNRDTDRAWMETDAWYFLDKTGEITEGIEFKAGSDANDHAWIELSNKIELFANHKDIVKKVVTKLKAHW